MLYIEELKELKKEASPWAFDPSEIDTEPNHITIEGLGVWLVACIVCLFHYGKPSAEDLADCSAWCSGGLWLVPDREQAEALTIKRGEFKGYHIKGAKITKYGRPLLELWNDAEDVKILSD